MGGERGRKKKAVDVCEVEVEGGLVVRRRRGSRRGKEYGKVEEEEAKGREASRRNRGEREWVRVEKRVEQERKEWLHRRLEGKGREDDRKEGWKEGDTERGWEKRGGQGEYAAQLMMSTSALESSGESMRGQVDHKVPN